MGGGVGGLGDVSCPTIYWELSAGLVTFTPVSLLPLHGETTTVLQPFIKAFLLLIESYQPPVAAGILALGSRSCSPSALSSNCLGVWCLQVSGFAQRARFLH